MVPCRKSKHKHAEAALWSGPPTLGSIHRPMMRSSISSCEPITGEHCGHVTPHQPITAHLLDDHHKCVVIDLRDRWQLHRNLQKNIKRLNIPIIQCTRNLLTPTSPNIARSKLLLKESFECTELNTSNPNSGPIDDDSQKLNV